MPILEEDYSKPISRCVHNIKGYWELWSAYVIAGESAPAIMLLLNGPSVNSEQLIPAIIAPPGQTVKKNYKGYLKRVSFKSGLYVILSGDGAKGGLTIAE